MLQDGLQLALEDLMELLSDFNAAIDLRKLLDAVYEELEFLEDLPQDLDVLVVDWLVQEVVEAEATSNDEHKALVELAGDVKEQLVVVLELQAVVLYIVDHSCLLLIEELPDFENILEVVAGHLVEMALLETELFLILFFEHLEVKAEEALDFGGVFGLQAVDVVEEVVEGLQKPLVQLRPAGREVLLHENAGHQRKLIVCILTQNTVIRILNKS